MEHRRSYLHPHRLRDHAFATARPPEGAMTEEEAMAKTLLSDFAWLGVFLWRGGIGSGELFLYGGEDAVEKSGRQTTPTTTRPRKEVFRDAREWNVKCIKTAQGSFIRDISLSVLYLFIHIDSAACFARFWSSARSADPPPQTVTYLNHQAPSTKHQPLQSPSTTRSTSCPAPRNQMRSNALILLSPFI
jgi:hypothetical protein